MGSHLWELICGGSCVEIDLWELICEQSSVGAHVWKVICGSPCVIQLLFFFTLSAKTRVRSTIDERVPQNKSSQSRRPFLLKGSQQKQKQPILRPQPPPQSQAGLGLGGWGLRIVFFCFFFTLSAKTALWIENFGFFWTLSAKTGVRSIVVERVPKQPKFNIETSIRSHAVS